MRSGEAGREAWLVDTRWEPGSAGSREDLHVSGSGSPQVAGPLDKEEMWSVCSSEYHETFWSTRWNYHGRYLPRAARMDSILLEGSAIVLYVWRQEYSWFDEVLQSMYIPWSRKNVEYAVGGAIAI